MDALGLLRCRRVIFRCIGDDTEALGHLVGLIEDTTRSVFIDSSPDEVRGAATLVKAASAQLLETSLSLAAHLGALRLLADLEGITIEEPEAGELGPSTATKKKSR